MQAFLAKMTVAFAGKKLVKLMAVFAGIFLFFVIALSCIFEIIFSELGFDDADQYATQLYAVETENLLAGLPSFFVEETDGIRHLKNNETINAELKKDEEIQIERIDTEYARVLSDVEASGSLSMNKKEIDAALNEEITEDIIEDTTGKGMTAAEKNVIKDQFSRLNADCEKLKAEMETEERLLAQMAAGDSPEISLEGVSFSDVTYSHTDPALDAITEEDIDTADLTSFTDLLSDSGDLFRTEESGTQFLQYTQDIRNVNLASSFWKGGAVYGDSGYDRTGADSSGHIPYLDCFTVILQNKGSKDILTAVENMDQGRTDDVIEYLTRQVADYEWFDYSSSEHVNSSDTVEVSVPVKSPYTYDLTIQYTVTATYDVVKTREVPDLDENGNQKVDENGKKLTRTIRYTETETRKETKTKVKTISCPDFRYVVDYTYALSNVHEDYTIRLNPQIIETKSITQNQKYRYVEDDETLNLAVGLLKGVSDGKWADFVMGLLKLDITQIRERFSSVAHEFQKEFSYRNYLESMNTDGTASGGGVFTGVSDAESIYRYLRQNGFHHEAVCAILGNLYCESGFNPAANSGSYYGLFQWGGGRNQNLISYCERNGYDYQQASGQLAFFLYEFPLRCKKVSEYMMDPDHTDIRLLTMEFAAGYEGCIGSTGNPLDDGPYLGSLYPSFYGKTFQGMAKRILYANRYAQEFIQYADMDTLDFITTDITTAALTHIGQHYVWGGNSYCNDWSDGVGIDCSHFVRRIMIDAGYWPSSVPYYPTSSMVNGYTAGGYAVLVGGNNWQDAMPGDILVFSGHTGIYIGDGKMCNALGKKYGVVVSDLRTSYKKPIQAILRPVKIP